MKTEGRSLSSIRGTIDRRILVNYRVDPEIAARLLPEPLRPKLAGEHAVAGICLIRLTRMRPAFLPLDVGVTSENAAHRIAVEWDAEGRCEEGVFIPRRDTSSRINRLVGGRLFPGIHHPATFLVDENEDELLVRIDSDDGTVRVAVEARVAEGFGGSSLFRSLEEASGFFRGGATGYSIGEKSGRLDGLELETARWSVTPLDVLDVSSSFFEDESRFPPGTAAFDNALLMRGIDHAWHARRPLYVEGPKAVSLEPARRGS